MSIHLSKIMGELSSIAFRSSLHSSSVGFDFHNLEVFNAEMFQFNHEMESSINSNAWTPPSAEASDFSTGYLEDVLFEFNCKRRRLFLFTEHQNQDSMDHNSMVNCWTSNFMQDCCENFDSVSQIIKCDTISDMRTPEEAVSETYDSLSSSLKESSMDSQYTPDKENLCIRGPIVSSAGGNDPKKRSKRALAKVVMCPFALVKPGGFEGNVTLNDINKRILMPPTRAVRHPVGEFAARPLVSPKGPGLSGKSVVAFTKIQTHGRGTITIIRTRN
ncbi:uncharacterized protein [Primulina huaijiensis]|uniref:uncharacterized protein n=1 Tax=Primulina huaijiensis TaxID=1492673 RepID=UPI003CC74E7A